MTATWRPAAHAAAPSYLPAALLAAVAVLTAPAHALAWGHEGHEIVATIARSYLTPQVRARVDALLAMDPDTLTAPDMISRSTWADAYREQHRATSQWHYVNIELDRPDLSQACFGFPPGGGVASQGPAEDCVVNKIEEFEAELSSPGTSPAERILALKFLLHLVGDLHQPLHAADNRDRGGNCVQVSLGGPRATNLHQLWDTALVEALGRDPKAIAAKLRSKITPVQLRTWEAGDARSWAMESFGVARRAVYAIGSRSGCGEGVPVPLPSNYLSSSEVIAAVQLEKAGVRLAKVLNRALDHV